MAGRPQARASRAAAEAARRELAERKTAEQREGELMRGREFAGHSPPIPPREPSPALVIDVDDLDAVEKALLGEPGAEGAHLLSSLWPKAYAALEAILDDYDASPASKVQAAKIVREARDKEIAAENANRPVRLIFETAAYIPPEAA